MSKFQNGITVTMKRSADIGAELSVGAKYCDSHRDAATE